MSFSIRVAGPLSLHRNKGGGAAAGRQEGRPQHSVVPRRSAPLSKKHILIVEERFELARHAFELLSSHGFDVELACTGRRGAEMARVRRPDLIVVTLNIDQDPSAGEAAGDMGALHVPTVVRAGLGGKLSREMVDALQPLAVLRDPVSDADVLEAVAAAFAETSRRATGSDHIRSTDDNMRMQVGDAEQKANALDRWDDEGGAPALADQPKRDGGRIRPRPSGSAAFAQSSRKAFRPTEA